MSALLPLLGEERTSLPKRRGRREGDYARLIDADGEMYPRERGAQRAALASHAV